MTQYKYLTQQQIDFITKHYTNQETADDVQELLILACEVGLDITTTLVTFEDNTADLVIKREDGQIKYFGDLCRSPLWLSKHIQAFGGGLDIALDILDDVLAWIEEGEQEELNTQVLKANFLLDLVTNTGFQLSDNKTIEYNHYELMSLEAEAERVEAQEKSNIYTQMYRSISNQQILDILHKSLDDEGKQKLLFELIS